METGFSSKVQAAQFCTSVQYLLTFTYFLPMKGLQMFLITRLMDKNNLKRYNYLSHTLMSSEQNPQLFCDYY